MVALQQHLVPLPEIERCHDHDRVMSPTAQLKERQMRHTQAVFRGASLNAVTVLFSFRDDQDCPRNWAAGVDNTAADNTVSLSWDEMLFGTVTSRDT